MDANRRAEAGRGIVVSDLHLFAQRSQGAEHIDSIRSDLASARVLVLNGDIFDFRWSTLRDVDATATAAVDWLRDLLKKFPQCEIHYILGNHDCVKLFRNKVAALAVSHPQFYCHEYGVRLGSALFLHGDCAHWKMDPARLRRYRQSWDNHRQPCELRSRAHFTVTGLSITRLTLRQLFPRRKTVERVVHYLDQAWPDWRRSIGNCYFGHTHLPFSDYRHDGVTFHNTGSAIRGMDFNPIAFAAAQERAESFSNPSWGRNGNAD